jgi:hypothetical protein
MKRTILAAIMVFLILSPIGCGHNSSSPSIFTTFIISDPVYDGDISDNGTITYAINTQSVLAGIDPFSPFHEFRAFLDFPLTGSNGVPGNAIIDSAFLDIFIDSVDLSTGTTIPIRIDLVSFQPPTLVSTDFDTIQLPALASMTINIFQSDALHRVNIDVTPLMTEAQRLGLLDFQIRILEDLNATIPGIIQIDDRTGLNRVSFAPQLQVNYF